jgi:hypothetical protein
VFFRLRALRVVLQLLPYPLNLAVLLAVLVVTACVWWHRARDDTLRRGKPYGQVVPAPWREPVPPPYLSATPPGDGDQEERSELGAGRAGPNA